MFQMYIFHDARLAQVCRGKEKAGWKRQCV